MAGEREIKNRIKSIAETRKITNAMYMISSTRLSRAKEILDTVTPFYWGLQNELERIIRHMPDIRNKYFGNTPEYLKRPMPRHVGIFVVTADKGLTGAFTHNIMKVADEALERSRKRGDHTRLYVVGEQGRRYCLSRGYDVSATFDFTAGSPSRSRSRDISDYILKRYNESEGRLDEIQFIFTSMTDKMGMRVENRQVLPLQKQKFLGYSESNMPEGFSGIINEEFTMLPSPEAVVDSIVPGYIAGMIYGILIESACCEQNSRMMAMKSATDNADEMLKELSVQRNRVRQESITMQITEVCSGRKMGITT
ncbi:MAG: ATP synthase F1 subunit gamma [Lachnospiraceae bacterium]|nr:ATP synthase F1 subunit gamma [Lachnospiraceae bacterium]